MDNFTRLEFEQTHDIEVDDLPNAVHVDGFLICGYCKYCGKKMEKVHLGDYNHYCKERGEILDRLIQRANLPTSEAIAFCK